MAVLTHPVGWRRKAQRDVGAWLTPDEQAAVKVSLAFLRRRFGTWSSLAAAMGTNVYTVKCAAYRGGVSAGIALMAARAAKVPLEDILSGRWPTPGTCPHCGRG